MLSHCWGIRSHFQGGRASLVRIYARMTGQGTWHAVGVSSPVSCATEGTEGGPMPQPWGRGEGLFASLGCGSSRAGLGPSILDPQHLHQAPAGVNTGRGWEGRKAGSQVKKGDHGKPAMRLSRDDEWPCHAGRHRFRGRMGTKTPATEGGFRVYEALAQLRDVHRALMKGQCRGHLQAEPDSLWCPEW